MDFQVDEHQELLLDTAGKLVKEHASPSDGGLNRELVTALVEAGLLEHARTAETAVLDAVLLTERLSRDNAMVPFGVCSLVGGLFRHSMENDLLTIAHDGGRQPIRYASSASLLVMLNEADAGLYRVDPATADPISANYIYPLALPAAPGQLLESHDHRAVLRRWRLAVAAETIGAMDGAMDAVLEHLRSRAQFGQPLGSFQAIQHRMAEHATALETSRWLVREAAWHDADDLAATSAAFTANAGHRFCLDAHQLFGARGFLLATGLHRWTLRIKLLSMEGGGERVHSEAAATARWNSHP